MNRKHEACKSLQEKASTLMPLGVNSNARYWGDGENLYVSRAKGPYIWDVDGNRYIDYRLAFGPIILGYAYDAVDDRVIQALRRGVTTGLTSELELSLAERVTEMVPSVQMLRIVNSGTEATMHAIRVARAFTGREKIIKFEGGYHGGHDYVLFSTYAPPQAYGNRRSSIPIPASSGIPSALSDLVITLPFNDFEALDSALSRAGHQVAAVISEPMLGNFGTVDPAPGFLNHVRARCDEYGILLILDEVKTGFRVAVGGAQQVEGIRPDLSTFAKSMGNGYPIAAYGGRAQVMEIVGRGVTQGGTYSGNLVGVAAADATLELLSDGKILETLNERGTYLRNGVIEILQRAGMPAVVSKYPTIFSVSFGTGELKDARDWAKCDQLLYRRLAKAMLNRGVLIDDDPREPWCISYSHTRADLSATLSALEDAVSGL
jgi:glutamate-1-semialdehyde 2,1-aminomutase